MNSFLFLRVSQHRFNFGHPHRCHIMLARCVPQRFQSSALSGEKREEALSKLMDVRNNKQPLTMSTWQETADERDAIQKTFEFTDFSQAWSFMSRSSLLAEKVCVCVHLIWF